MPRRDDTSIPTRPALPGDALALARISAAGFDTYRAWAPAGWTPPESGDATDASRLRAQLVHPAAWSRVADGERGPVGFALVQPAFTVNTRAEPLEGVAHLLRLFVLPAWWGTGVAAQLLREATAAAAAEGYDRMRLWTPAGHARAQAFYRREGFTRVGDAFEEPQLALSLIELWRDVP